MIFEVDGDKYKTIDTICEHTRYSGNGKAKCGYVLMKDYDSVWCQYLTPNYFCRYDNNVRIKLTQKVKEDEL